MTLKSIRTVMVVLLAILAMESAADEKTLDRAKSASEAGNYAIAYCLLLPLAKMGNAEAQNRLAWLYHLGNGLAIDDEQAVYWWEQAASKEHPSAIMALADLYRQGGKGIQVDAEKAVHYLMQAARSGEEDARLLLASYFSGSTKPEVRRAAARIIQETPELMGPPLRVSVPKANLRAGPGTGYRIAGSLQQGDIAYEISRQGDWVHLALPQEPWLAWVYAKLVTAATAPEPATTQ